MSHTWNPNTGYAFTWAHLVKGLLVAIMAHNVTRHARQADMVIITYSTYLRGATNIHSCVVILKQAHADPTLNTDIFTVRL